MFRILGRCLRSPLRRLGAATLLALTVGLGLAPSMTGVATAANSDPQGMIIGGGGRCIGPANGSHASGTPLQLQDCTGFAQTWQIDSNGTIVGVFGMCMDVRGGGTADGTLLQLWTCNGTGAQQWQRSGTALVNPQSGRCIDAQSTHTFNGTGLQIWDCISGAPQQSYTTPPSGPEVVISSGVGRTGEITTSGGCLDTWNDDGAIQAPALIAPCGNTVVGQQWTMEDDGTIRTQGRCLDVAGAGTADGTPVRLWDCNGTVAQQWLFGGGLENPYSGKCLDTPQDAGVSGTYLVIFDCNGHASQNFGIPSGDREVALASGPAVASNPQTPGIQPGTSPSAVLYGAGEEIAFNGPGGLLWVTDPDGRTHRALDTDLPVEPGTSPSVASNGFFWQIAYHGINGDLWFADSSGNTNDFGPQMFPGASPSSVAVSNGYETALAGQNGMLWVVGRDGTNYSLSLFVAEGTNPAITALNSGQTWGVAARAADGKLHLAFHEPPDGAGQIAEHSTGQAVEDGSSPATAAFSSDTSPEVAFAGPDGHLRLMDSSGNVTQFPSSAPPISGGTSPAYAVDVNGGSGHWQIAWQAQDEDTLWTYGNNFFSPAVGAQTTDWGVVMGGDTSPALPSLIATPITVCCVVGGF